MHETKVTSIKAVAFREAPDEAGLIITKMDEFGNAYDEELIAMPKEIAKGVAKDLLKAVDMSCDELLANGWRNNEIF